MTNSKSLSDERMLIFNNIFAYPEEDVKKFIKDLEEIFPYDIEKIRNLAGKNLI